MQPRTLSLEVSTLARLALCVLAATALVGTALTGTAPAGAQVPTTLSYQGRVLDDVGQVVAGPVDVTFSLWSDDTGGTQLWSESWPGVALSNGVFSVLLGSNGSPLDPADFQGDTTLYLQLQIDGEVLLPRQALGSAPFALVDEPGNELQDLELDGDILRLSGSAATVDLSLYLDDTDTDTDAQDLSLVGDTLSLTNDPTPVDLAPYRDNTDAQELTLDGGVLSLTDGGSVDLSGSRKRVLFVTSAKYTGNLGGLAGADAKCQDLASAAGLGGTFLAWLSDDTGSPSTRLSRQGSFIRVDGAQVAVDWGDLTDGTLTAAIEVTENGTIVGSGSDAWVWTNTRAAGGPDYTGPSSTCDRWSSGSGTLEGQIGVATATDDDWTIWSGLECDGPRRLYCVQEPSLVGPDDQVLSLDGDTLKLSSDDGPDFVDLSKYTDAPQTLTISGSVLTLSGSGSIDLVGREERRVFITSTTYDGALGGLAGADAKCWERAAAAGWAGTFLPWLSDPTGSPSTRFDQRGSFVRPDGVVVADDWADLTDGTLDAAISVDELGGVHGAFDLVWTATNTNGTYRGPHDCASWTSLSFGVSAWLGSPAWTDLQWTGGGTNGTCSGQKRLYCFETYTTIGSDDQQLSLVGNELHLTSDDGDDVVDLSGIAGTDAQTLSLTGDTLTISGSGSAVDLALANTIVLLLDRIAALEASVPRTVFVTSQSWNGDLGGIAGGDAKCQQLADDEGLAGTFRAWLSDAAGSPSSSFVQGARPFQLVDGTRIADDWADLTDALLDSPILLDETGATVTVDVWTNTDTAGNRAVADGDCAGWTNPSSGATGRVGSSTAADQFWTSFTFANCAQLRRLYCSN